MAIKDQIREALQGEQYREFAIDPETLTRADGDAAGLIEMAFASEAPVRRWFGDEILDHSPGSVRLDRLNGGAPLLVNHDRSDQAGAVSKGSARVDDDRVLRASVRFSQSAYGQEIETDVHDEIRSHTSLGYKIHEYTVTEREGQPDLIRVTDWEPIEVSLASIPADISVGVGRSDEETQHTAREEPAMTTETETAEREAPAAQPAAPATPPIDAAAERQRIRTEEARRRSAIDEVADTYGIPDEVRQEAIRNEDESWDIDKFRAEALRIVGERNNAAKAESGRSGEVDLSSGEHQQFSMVRLLDYLADPDNRRAKEAAAFELEVSREGARQFGSDFQARGEFVPTSIMTGIRQAALDGAALARALGPDAGRLNPEAFIRALSAGGATAGAELVGTDHLASAFVEVLRNTSSAMRAGLTMLPGLVGNVDIPRQTSGAQSQWLPNEDDDAQESEPTFDQITLSPKDLACYTEFTRRLTQQSAPAIEGLVRSDLAAAQALGIDKAVIYGTGAAGQPMGVANQAGINTVDFAAAAPSYVEIVQMIKKVMEDNALVAMAQWMIEANGWESLSITPKQATGAEGNFILGDDDRIKGYNYIQSQQIETDDFFFGVWSQVIMGEWGGLEINVDPYTHSLKGRIRYVTFKTADIAVRHPEAFCHGKVFTP